MGISRRSAALSALLFIVLALPGACREALIVFDALLQAYPESISQLELRNGDWSILVNGVRIYWAEGRLLPEESVNESAEYSRYHFRAYPENLPPLRELNPEELRRLNEILARRESRQDSRNPAFLEALWGMEDFWTAENTVERMDFLGKNIRIHPGLKDKLLAVEEEILRAAESDEKLEEWIEGLSTAGAYVWREIAGSANRSLHSFGIAVDLVPGTYAGKQAYWRWASDLFPQWWRIPHEDRYFPPQTVIRAFEDHGFTWGGKWFLFDQIHFEYRPELFLLPAETNEAEDRRVR